MPGPTSGAEACRRPSPHEKGWNGNPYKGELLERSVENGKVPFTIFRPANSPNLNSTRVLGKVAAEQRKLFLTGVFPPMEIPEGEADPDKWVHVHFVQEFDAIIQWGPVGRHFMAIFGVE